MSIDFLKVAGQQRVKELADTARQIWFEYFPGIITEGQVEYMVQKFQSADAVAQQIESGGYEYYLMKGDEKILGYLGIREEAEKLFLSKLYLSKESRGKGYFNRMLSFVEKIAGKRNLKSLYLTVNKHNDHAISVYRKKGFSVIRSQKTDIGGGFFMDDYVMEKEPKM